MASPTGLISGRWSSPRRTSLAGGSTGPSRTSSAPSRPSGSSRCARPARRPAAASGPNRAHRPCRLDEAWLVDVVLELLAPPRVAHDPLEVGFGRPAAQRLAQVGLVEREQARPQLAVRGQPDPVAVTAERLGHGVDEADAPGAVG